MSLLKKWLSKHSLTTVLIYPFVIQITLAVGLTGFLAFLNGRAAVNQVASQLREEISARIVQKLDSYLATAPQINRINVNTLHQELIDFKDTEALQSYLLEQIAQFETVDLLSIATTDGEYSEAQRTSVGKIRLGRSGEATGGFLEIWDLNEAGERTVIALSRPNYDPRERPWYQKAIKIGKPAWSEVYTLFSNDELTIAANQPIYDRQTNELQGVASTNLTLSQLSQFLSEIKVGQTGQTYIMERSGLLVATSTEQRLVRRVDIETLARLNATESRDPLTKASSEYLLQQFGTLEAIDQVYHVDFTYNNQNIFLEVTPFKDERGINWLIVVVAPSSDFMEQIWNNTAQTVLLCALALLLTVTVGIVTTKSIVEPITHLNQVAKEVAQGNWSERVPATQKNEVGQLARTFNKMAEQLQHSFQVLKNNEKKYRRLFEDSNDAIILATPEGRFLDINSAGVALLGYKNRLQVLASNIKTLYVDPTARQKALEEVQHTGYLDNFETRWQQMDGTIKEVSISSAARRAEDGSILSLQTIVRDITLRKQNEAELQQYRDHLEQLVSERTAELSELMQKLYESRQLVRAVIDSTPDWIFAKDRELRWILVNQSIADALNMTPQEIVGKTDLELGFPEKLVMGDPETNQQGYWDDDRAVLAGETVYTPHDPARQTSLPSDRKFDTYKSPLRNQDGEIIGVVGLARDITLLKETEAALAAERNMLRTLIDTIPDSMYVKDTASRFQLCNVQLAQQFGLDDPEELVGKTDADLLPPEIAATSLQEERLLFKTGKPIRNRELLTRDSHDETEWLLVTKVALRDEMGNIIGLVGVNHDITERKLAEQNMREANKLLRQRVEELSMLSDLAQALSTVTSPQDVLDSVTEKVVNVFDAYSSGIILLDPKRTTFRIAAYFTHAPNPPKTDGFTYKVTNHPAAKRSLQTKKAMVIPNVATNPLVGPFQKVLSKQHIESLMLAPLLVRGEMIGALFVETNQAEREFTIDEIQLLETISGQIAGAVESARLFDEEQQQRRVAESLREVATVLSSTLDQQTVVTKIFEELRQVIHYDSVSFFLKEDDWLVLTAGLHLSPDKIGYRTKIESQHLAAEVFQKQKLFIIPDVQQHPSWQEDLSNHQIRGWMAAPLFTHSQAVGVLCLDSFTPNTYGPKEGNILQIFANQAAIAVQNARLFAEVNSLNERLRTENLRLEAEVEIAHQIQAMLLPTSTELAQIEELEIEGFMEPAEEVGGDYYDVLRHKGVIKIGIGDVTGHGLASGILALMTQTAVRTLLMSGETDAVQFLDALNRTMFANIERMGLNKSLTLSLLDYHNGTLRLSGQHEDLIFVRRDGTVKLIKTDDLGFPLGLDDNIINFINTTTLQLAPGEGMVLYTDGITEAENEAQQLYGLPRLCQVVSQSWEQSVFMVKETIIADVRQHIGRQPLFDDLTLLIIRRQV